MEPPSARPWLGVGAALSALPAAGGCYFVALALVVLTGSDPGAVHEQHRWLGPFAAAGAVCAFVAMLGWTSLRQGGLPAPVLLMALALAAVPFLLPGGLIVPAAALAVAGSAALATVGLARPPEFLDGAESLVALLARAAIGLTIVYVLLVMLQGGESRPEARAFTPPPEGESEQRGSVDGWRASKGKGERGTPRLAVRKRPPASPEWATRPAKPRAEKPRRKPARPAPAKSAPAKPAPAKSAPAASAPTPARPAPAKPAPPKLAPAKPAPSVPSPAESGGTEPARAAPGAGAVTAARRFVRDYYAALDRRRFAVAWGMLAPEVQRSFGTFAGWRKGYARTVSHSAGGLQVFPAGEGAVVWLTLRAGDRSACGTTVVRRFVVTWRLARTEAGWRATAADARKVGGPEPSAVCSL